MKKQKGLATLYIAIAVAVVVGMLLLGMKFLYKENKDLTKDVAKKDVVIELQKDGIDKIVKSGKVTEETSMEVAKKTEELDKKADTIKDSTEAKVEQINKEFQKRQAEVTSKNAAALQAEIKELSQKNSLETQRINAVSAARIDGLWETYCLAVPKDASCTPAEPVSPVKTSGGETPSYEALRMYVSTFLLGRLNPPADVELSSTP